MANIVAGDVAMGGAQATPAPVPIFTFSTPPYSPPTPTQTPTPTPIGSLMERATALANRLFQLANQLGNIEASQEAIALQKAYAEEAAKAKTHPDLASQIREAVRAELKTALGGNQILARKPAKATTLGEAPSLATDTNRATTTYAEALQKSQDQKRSKPAQKVRTKELVIRVGEAPPALRNRSPEQVIQAIQGAKGDKDAKGIY